MDNSKLSKNFVSWITQNDFKNNVIIEIGSGYSTLLFSKHFKFVYSFEDNIEWFLKIDSLLKPKG